MFITLVSYFSFDESYEQSYESYDLTTNGIIYKSIDDLYGFLVFLIFEVIR